MLWGVHRGSSWNLISGCKVVLLLQDLGEKRKLNEGAGLSMGARVSLKRNTANTISSLTHHCSPARPQTLRIMERSVLQVLASGPPRNPLLSGLE